MTFSDKWGTYYPEEVRKFINPGRLSNIDRDILGKAMEITSDAISTDGAILAIHSFMKDVQSKRMPAINSDPVLNASGVLEKISLNPNEEMLPRDKVVLEVALLRSNDIPARVAMYECNARSPAMLSTRRVKSMFTTPKVTFFSTEVYTNSKDGNEDFVPKDAWIPESECDQFDGTCMVSELKNWRVNREIKGAIDIASCKKKASHDDYPITRDVLSRAGSIAREYMHVIDVIDPVGGET